MFGLQKSLRNSKNDVYVAKRNNSVSKRVNVLYDGVRCSECGSTHFRYEQEVKIGEFPFYGHTCLTCGNLIFMDKDAMIDHPMSGKQSFQNEPIPVRYVSNKSKLLL
jgi:predicted  nucleic acid-binding Zn-ribbon protein